MKDRKIVILAILLIVTISIISVLLHHLFLEQYEERYFWVSFSRGCVQGGLTVFLLYYFVRKSRESHRGSDTDIGKMNPPEADSSSLKD
jgi:hypothetical protein